MMIHLLTLVVSLFSLLLTLVVSLFSLLLFTESVAAVTTYSLRGPTEMIVDKIGDQFDRNQADISVWLSAAASCGDENIKSHTFKGLTTGFVVTYTINDLLTDTEGYIGYLPSDQSIYVVYRGTDSGRDWITDIDAHKSVYTSF
jgi:hypothetical protein